MIPTNGNSRRQRLQSRVREFPAVFEDQNFVFGIPDQVTVRFGAFFDAVHDLVHPFSQFGIVFPAKLVARTHQESPCDGPRQVFEPFDVDVAVLLFGDGFAGADAEVAQHVVDGERGEEVVGVAVHDLAEQSADPDPFVRDAEFRFDGTPRIGRSDIFRAIQYGEFAHRTGSPQ